MSSKTEICNLAITHLGVGKTIDDVDTESSEEALICRRYYDTVRDMTLRDYAWPFATKISSLALVESNPNTEWDYSYRYPSDALYIKRILSGVRNDNRQSRASYKIVRDDTGLLIYTDERGASIEYTAKTSDPTFYPSDFIMALSLHIAVYIAPKLTKGDPFGMANKVMQMYEMEISRAKAKAANEEQLDQRPDSEFIRVREGYDGFGGSIGEETDT